VVVFEYSGTSVHGDHRTERGTILARDKLDAFDKLKRRDLANIHLKRVEGFSALIAKFTATVR
jgi:type II secretory pathway component PulF